MRTLQKQRGAFDIEGLEKPGRSKGETPSSAPKTSQPPRDRDPEGSYQEFKRRSGRPLIRFRVALAAVAGAFLLLWVAYMFRYEIIPVSATVGTVQYIVKDRWTGEIEVVWQNPDGNRKSSRQPFE